MHSRRGLSADECGAKDVFLFPVKKKPRNGATRKALEADRRSAQASLTVYFVALQHTLINLLQMFVAKK